MKNKIPEISDKELKRLAKRIKPLVRFELDDWSSTKPKKDEDGEPIRAHTGVRWWALFDIKSVDLRNIAYTWEPRPTGKPRHNISCFDIIRTYHRCGHIV
jgi:hypothetical protein